MVRAAVERNGLEPDSIDEIYMGCANQAGEDNRNVARMAGLLAGLPVEVPGATVNRLCASGLEAAIQGSRQLKVGEADLVLAGGVESMTRAPLVMLKPEQGFPRGNVELADTTLGWRLVNPSMEERLDRVDGRDGRERGRALRRLARRTRTPSRSSPTGARSPPPRPAASTTRSSRSTCPSPRASRSPCTPTRARGPTPASSAWPS